MWQIIDIILAALMFVGVFGGVMLLLICLQIIRDDMK